MIEIYTGAVGAGKSYHAMARAVSQLGYRKGHYVVANFPIKFTKTDIKKGRDKWWNYVDDAELTPRKLIQLSIQNGWVGHESMCLLVVDEAGIYFNARDWQISGELRKEWIKFFVNSRKFGYDVVLIAQDARMIDRQIRTIAEYTVKHVKLRNYKWFKLLPVQIFACISYWAGGSFKGSIEFVVYKPWVGNRYDTMKLFDIRLLEDATGTQLSPSDVPQEHNPPLSTLPDSQTEEKGAMRRLKFSGYSGLASRLNRINGVTETVEK